MPTRTVLCNLAKQHGTDKLGVYTPFYDLILGPRRQSVRSVLEVGIGYPEIMAHVPGYRAGASLRMWRDYFPRADIYGLDIHTGAVAEAGRELGVHTSCWPIPADWPEQFDLIVDDGSHDPDDQLETLKILSSRIANGGLYIIEDVDKFSDVTVLLEREHTCIEHVHRLSTGRAILIYG